MEPVSVGAYNLDYLAGKGGMGQVWRGHHAESGLRVAVKVLTGPKASEPAYARAFAREVHAVARLDHPCVIQVYDYGTATPDWARATRGQVEVGDPYFVMEWVSGGSLADGRTPADWQGVRALLDDLLDALAHAHARGVLHRDIKASNVLWATDHDLYTGWRLADFGIATVAGETGETIGTPAYMAPEQIRGAWSDQGPWTDLYGLGCLAWLLLTGELPFTGPPARVLQGHLRQALPPFVPRIPVPPGLEDWLDRLLAKEPRARFTFAADARRKLDDLGQASPTSRASSFGGGAALDQPTLILGDRLPARDSVSRSALQLDLLRSGAKAARALPQGGRATVARPGPPPTRVELPEDWRESIGSARRPSPGLPGMGLGLVGLRPVPLVGRERERNALWGALRRVQRERQVRLVALVGPTGIGKTRLVHWLCQQAHERGVAVPVVVDDTTAGAGRSALEQAAKRLLGLGGLDRGRAVVRIRAWFDDRIEPGEARRLAELLTDGGTAPFTRTERFALMLLPLVDLTRDRPVVVALDGTHGGTEAIGFATHLLDSLEPALAPLLVTITLRTETLAERPELAQAFQSLLERPGAERIEIAPLSSEHRRALVRDVLGLAPDLAAKVEARTAGNPLFAVQLVNNWAEQGLLVAGPHGHHLSDPEAATLPPDLQAAWCERVERYLADYSSEAARAMELAATFGNEVRSGEWEAACGLAGIRAPWDLVDRLIQAGLVMVVKTAERGDEARRGSEAEDTTWRFTHGMVRESLERRAARAGRLAEWHRICAEVLSTRDLDEVAERLGRHHLGAGRPRQAIRPLLVAARRLYEQGENGAALDLLAERRRAMEAAGIGPEDLRRIEGWILETELYLDFDDLDRAEERADQLARAVEHLDGTPPRLIVLVLRSLVLQRRGRLDEALTLLEQAVDRPDSEDDPQAYLRGLRLLADLQTHRGDLAAAEKTTTVALAASQRLGAPQAIGWALYRMAVLRRYAGRYDEASDLAARAATLARSHGLGRLRAAVLNIQGDLARHRNALDEASRHYANSARIYQRFTGRRNIITEVNLGITLVESGRFDEARAVLQRCIHDRSVRDQPYVTAAVAVGLAAVAAGKHDWREFDEQFSRMVEVLDATGHHEPDFARIAAVSGRLARLGGDFERARRAEAFAIAHYRALGRMDEARGIEREAAAAAHAPSSESERSATADPDDERLSSDTSD